jgi:hypothetical protein
LTDVEGVRLAWAGGTWIPNLQGDAEIIARAPVSAFFHGETHLSGIASFLLLRELKVDSSAWINGSKFPVHLQPKIA